MAVITDKTEWKLVNQATRSKKGPLVNVSLGHGRYVKMHEQDAIEQGLLPGKSRPPEKNKLKVPEKDKAAEQPEEKAEEKPDAADDFTEIQGVGPATARALNANGITTFEQLRGAEALDFLPVKAVQAIDDWRATE